MDTTGTQEQGLSKFTDDSEYQRQLSPATYHSDGNAYKLNKESDSGSQNCLLLNWKDDHLAPFPPGPIPLIDLTWVVSQITVRTSAYEPEQCPLQMPTDQVNAASSVGKQTPNPSKKKIPNRSKRTRVTRPRNKVIPTCARTTPWPRLNNIMTPSCSTTSAASEVIASISKTTSVSEVTPSNSKTTAASEVISSNSRTTAASEVIPSNSKTTAASEVISGNSKTTVANEVVPSNSKMTADSKVIPSDSNTSAASKVKSTRSKSAAIKKTPRQSKISTASKKTTAQAASKLIPKTTTISKLRVTPSHSRTSLASQATSSSSTLKPSAANHLNKVHVTPKSTHSKMTSADLLHESTPCLSKTNAALPYQGVPCHQQTSPFHKMTQCHKHSITSDPLHKKTTKARYPKTRAVANPMTLIHQAPRHRPAPLHHQITAVIPLHHQPLHPQITAVNPIYKPESLHPQNFHS